MAKRLEADQFPLMGYCNRGGGKSALRNGVIQNLKCTGEDDILLLVSRNRQQRGVE